MLIFLRNLSVLRSLEPPWFKNGCPSQCRCYRCVNTRTTQKLQDWFCFSFHKICQARIDVLHIFYTKLIWAFSKSNPVLAKISILSKMKFKYWNKTGLCEIQNWGLRIKTIHTSWHFVIKSEKRLRLGSVWMEGGVSFYTKEINCIIIKL